MTEAKPSVRLSSGELKPGRIYQWGEGEWSYFGQARLFELVSVGPKWIRFRSVELASPGRLTLTPERKVARSGWPGANFVEVAGSLEEFTERSSERSSG